MFAEDYYGGETMASSKDKEQYIYNTTNGQYTKEDGSETELSKYINNEISESKNAYNYYDQMGNIAGEKASNDRAEYARNLLGYYTSDDAGTQKEIDDAYINSKIADEQKNWSDAYEAGDQFKMDASHAAAQRYRQMLGYASGDDGSTQITEDEMKSYVDNEIAQAKQEWQKAYENNDKSGMASAHYRAEKARAAMGYSGGDDGNANMNIFNGANYQNDVDTPFVTNIGSYNSTSEQPAQRYKVNLNGTDYWLDSNGTIYDSYQNGNAVGSGWNSSTNSMTYSDDQQARDYALKTLEERYGVTGWQSVLERMGLDTSSIPDELLSAAKSGTLFSYVNNLEQKQAQKASQEVSSADLISLLSQVIGNNASQYTSPSNWNNASSATGSLVDSTGTTVSGYAPQSTLGQQAGVNLLQNYINPYAKGR